MLLSLIFLGFAATELHAIRETRANLNFFIATIQLENMLERLKTSQGQNLSEIVAQWNAENAIYLPQGFGQVAGNYPIYTTTIYWGGYNATCAGIQLGLAGCIHENISI